MQFKPAMIEAIKAGRKTQTRRPVKNGDRSTRIGRMGDHGFIEDVVFHVMDANGRGRWRLFGIYSLCPGRGKARVGLIKVNCIRLESVSEISEADARAEGFESREAFLAAWKNLYPKSDLQENVWVLEFRLA